MGGADRTFKIVRRSRPSTLSTSSPCRPAGGKIAILRSMRVMRMSRFAISMVGKRKFEALVNTVPEGSAIQSPCGFHARLTYRVPFWVILTPKRREGGKNRERKKEIRRKRQKKRKRKITQKRKRGKFGAKEKCPLIVHQSGNNFRENYIRETAPCGAHNSTEQTQHPPHKTHRYKHTKIGKEIGMMRRRRVGGTKALQWILTKKRNACA